MCYISQHLKDIITQPKETKSRSTSFALLALSDLDIHHSISISRTIPEALIALNNCTKQYPAQSLSGQFYFYFVFNVFISQTKKRGGGGVSLLFQ